jgi:hypothetical protein
MCEVLRRPAYFPNSLVRLTPDLRHVTENTAADRNRAINRWQTMALGHIQSVEDLAIHIELCLLHRGIADPHRPRAFVPGQPWHLPLRQPPLAPKPVHDLQLVRAAGDGPQQPIPPCAGLVIKSRMHQSQQREGGVAQPAVAVVPISRAADLLGQRGGRRRDNSAGRGEGQALQRDQRAFDGLGPRTGGRAP